MADYNSSLPVRTEADGADERLHVKIVDGTTPSQRATVDTDGNLHVLAEGHDPAGAAHAIRTSEQGALTPDGVYDVANNTVPGNIGLIVSTRATTPDATTQSLRLTGVNSTTPDATVWALDVAMHDSSGNAFTEANPFPVYVAPDPGTKVNDYATSAALAANATANHDYTVTALKTLKFTQFDASGSGKIKISVAVETAIASGVFLTKWVFFNSTSEANIQKTIAEPITVAAGVRVRLAITNRDNQAQDVYSTISGHEI